MKIKRLSLKITGIVQGVGFRPTVYRYAKKQHLTGHISNTSQGVFIEVQGLKDNLKAFLEELKENPPPQAKIDEFLVWEIPTLNDSKESDFGIKHSYGEGEKDVAISPDLATCEDCRLEIFDPSNRRFGYPFTNCTNCGPRFTIIADRPYDRPLTSMKDFPMCPSCQAEYDDPMDRRFHAQPNACPDCGPTLSWLSSPELEEEAHEAMSPFELAIKYLKEGKTIGIKGLGGFNLACLESFSCHLRKVKKRPSKSFAVMMDSLETVKNFCEVSEGEEAWLKSPVAPIVLLKKKQNLNLVSPDNNYIGVMLPYTPLHHLLMEHFKGHVLVMTSANKRSEPLCVNDEEMLSLIKAGIAHGALSHNRAILHRADDSILQVIPETGKIQVIRRSRGFVPGLFKLKIKNELKSLAFGSNMKNTFALRKGEKIYMSQHIGELMENQNLLFQEEQINDFSKLLEIYPEAPHDILQDAHPRYEQYDTNPLVRKVYHHHAHLLSVLGEHDLQKNDSFEHVLGVALDGTGFGTDFSIWGCEFLSFSLESPQNFHRVAHLHPFLLAGGERAIVEVDRIAKALLIESDLNDLAGEGPVQNMIRENKHAIKCSSLGRLFDGVASLLGFTGRLGTSEYESQVAQLLQQAAEQSLSKKHIFQNQVNDEMDFRPMIREMMDLKLKAQTFPEDMAYAFHLWVVDSILKTLKKLLKPKTYLVFSGGCLQNRLLVSLLHEALRREDLSHLSYFNEEVPPNDAGISFGQIIFDLYDRNPI